MKKMSAVMLYSNTARSKLKHVVWGEGEGVCFKQVKSHI
jgi:hypothetical protein